MSHPVTQEPRCATCVCFCEDSRGAKFGTCISRRAPILGRKPAKRATDTACRAYSYWARPEQKTGSGDGTR